MNCGRVSWRNYHGNAQAHSGNSEMPEPGPELCVGGVLLGVLLGGPCLLHGLLSLVPDALQLALGLHLLLMQDAHQLFAFLVALLLQLRSLDECPSPRKVCSAKRLVRVLVLLLGLLRFHVVLFLHELAVARNLQIFQLTRLPISV